MMKRYAFVFVYILVVLMPLQSLASINFLLCNKVSQSFAHEMKNGSPCQMHKKPTQSFQHKNGDENGAQTQSQEDGKLRCASLCANILAMVIPATITLFVPLNNRNNLQASRPFYTSITPHNLQRPPISFI